MRRAYESLLSEYLESFPCVALIGPRQCGKTTLLRSLGDDWRLFDLERQSDFQLAARDPDLFLRLNPRKVALDEAQLLPSLFPALRVAVDEARGEAGRFVITGSSSPALLKAISESLAGRIGVIEMAPLSFAETRGDFGFPFATAITERTTTPCDIVASLTSRGDVVDAHHYWFQGGYPEPWLKSSARFRKIWMEQYFQSYLFRDVSRLFPNLSMERFRLFVQALGSFSGTIMNYAQIAETLGISQPTARDYVEIAHGTFLWRRLPAFDKNAMRRVARHPKGYLRDCGIFHHLLQIPDLDSLLAHPAMGRSWEGMVIEEILRAMSCKGYPCEAYHYRTAGGHEIDLLLEGDFGLIPIEIKHAQTVGHQSLQGLRIFVEERKCRFGVVVNNDVAPRLYDDRLVGVPFTAL